MKISHLVILLAVVGVGGYLIYSKLKGSSGYTLPGLTDTQGGQGFSFGDNT